MQKFLICAAVVCAAVVMATAQDAGWTSLFDGKTLKGWTVGGVNWTVVDGAISATPANQKVTPTGDSKQTWPQGFLRSVATFSDFEMTAEFWNEQDSNSSLFIRCQAPANRGKVNGETAVDVRDEKLRDGAIGLQAGGPTGSGPIKFRNIRIRPLSKG